jgi:hypothetical protein
MLGLGWINPEDRDDASDRAGYQRRCVTEPPVDPLGDNDWYLAAGRPAATSSQARTLERSSWRIRSIRARHWASCPAEGVGGSIDMGVASIDMGVA